MKKINVFMTTAFSLFICASFAIAQSEDFKLEYDRFKDRTTASSKLMILSGSYQDGVGMMLTATYDGKIPKKPDMITTAILLASSKRHIYDDRELILLLDGERLKLGSMQDGGRQYQSGVILEPNVM